MVKMSSMVMCMPKGCSYSAGFLTVMTTENDVLFQSDTGILGNPSALIRSRT